MDNNHAIEYWIRTLGVSAEELQAAIEEVGTSPSALRKYFIEHPREK